MQLLLLVAVVSAVCVLIKKFGHLVAKAVLVIVVVIVVLAWMFRAQLSEKLVEEARSKITSTVQKARETYHPKFRDRSTP